MSTSALALIVDNGFRKSWRSDAISGSLPVGSRTVVVRFMRSFRDVRSCSSSTSWSLQNAHLSAERKKTGSAPFGSIMDHKVCVLLSRPLAEKSETG
jgi:hypothetical protein